MAVVVEYEGAEYAFVIQDETEFWVDARNKLVPQGMCQELKKQASLSGIPEDKLEIPKVEPKITISNKKKRRKQRKNKYGICISVELKPKGEITHE